MRSLTSEVTTVPKAAPMTTATARSSTLPRRMKSRNPLSIKVLLCESARDPGPNTHRGESGAAALAVLGDLIASRGISAHLLGRQSGDRRPRVVAGYLEIAGVPKRHSVSLWP